MRAVVLSCCLVLVGVELTAQRRGGGPQPPRSARESAPVDLTGYWVSVVTEDWAWRMFTPRKGDYASVPLNQEGTRVADQWSPSEDGSCKAYGAAALLRMPTRLRITWEDDNTIRIDTDAGRQTRRLRFAGPAPTPGARDLQGHSVAQWQVANSAASSGADGGAAASGRTSRTWGTLKVVTTSLQGGWLRRNGVPYSQDAVVTEYFDRFTDEQDEWFTVTTIVEDPKYLAQPFITSSNFKKETDGAKWNPVACRQ
jgi:hypothetical protein